MDFNFDLNTLSNEELEEKIASTLEVIEEIEGEIDFANPADEVDHLFDELEMEKLFLTELEYILTNRE